MLPIIMRMLLAIMGNVNDDSDDGDDNVFGDGVYGDNGDVGSGDSALEVVMATTAEGSEFPCPQNSLSKFRKASQLFFVHSRCPVLSSSPSSYIMLR